MVTVVKSRIIKIGNSQGIRIPKLLLEQSALGEEIELVAERDQILVRTSRQARRGWDEAFQSMNERSDDELLDPDLSVTTEWDEDEWEW